MTNKIEKLNARLEEKVFPYSRSFYIAEEWCPSNDMTELFKIICDKIDEIIDHINSDIEKIKAED